jgi:hypothetical protein
MIPVNQELRRWRMFFGELHEELSVDEYIKACKFTWRMRYDAEEMDGFEYMDGLTALEAYEESQVQP